MTSSSHRRRSRHDTQVVEDAKPSSIRGAVLMIFCVFGAVSLLSLLFLLLPTSSRVNRGNLDSAIEANLNQGFQRSSTFVKTDNLQKAKVVWTAKLPQGSHGSPNLFFDEAHAVAIIAYGNERQPTGGASGIDVATGETRWQMTSQDEMFTLPMPLDIGNSSRAPWIVAGRNGQLYAVDAANGEQIWKFQPSGEEGRERGVYNFFTPRVLSDIDGDGIEDLVIPNGGDSRRNRFQARPPGHLFVVSGSDGKLLHAVEVPDKAETYLSPIVWDRQDTSYLIFGTGGETFAGSLWTVPLESIRSGKLDGAEVLVPNQVSKGAIPPPSLADLNNDGVLDLVTAPFDGRLLAISGQDLSTMWQFRPRGIHETQCSPTLGDFDGDGDLDVAYVTQRGVFPRWSASNIRVFDGLEGELIWEHQIRGNLSAASPLALDIDGDDRDELFVIHANPALFRASDSSQSMSQLQIVHVEENRIEELGAVEGFNAASGWIGDGDKDGQLEWIIPLKLDGGGGSLVKIDLETPTPSFIAWGGYLGTKHDGIYHPENSLQPTGSKLAEASENPRQ